MLSFVVFKLIILCSVIIDLLLPSLWSLTLFSHYQILISTSSRCLIRIKVIQLEFVLQHFIIILCLAVFLISWCMVLSFVTIGGITLKPLLLFSHESLTRFLSLLATIIFVTLAIFFFTATTWILLLKNLFECPHFSLFAFNVNLCLHVVYRSIADR